MKVIYFDCFSGISGDMVLGALADLGLDLETWKQALSSLKLSGYRLHHRRLQVGGISAIKVEVEVETEPPSRHLSHIKQLIAEGGLPAPVEEKAIAVFERLARAEAQVHGSTPEEVHFHEVGAIDAIIDVVGSVLGLHLLGAEAIYSSPLPLARGWVNSHHGPLPLPAPATAALLAGIPVYGVEEEGELVTPTGAALITTLASRFGPLPAGQALKVGYGAGTAKRRRPNLLRAFLMEVNQAAGPSSSPQPPWSYEADVVQVIEANLDDLTPEIGGYLVDRLMQAGALDVSFVPIQMKKNRPGFKLSVICPLEKSLAVIELIFAETTTLGVRHRLESRLKLPRAFIKVDTPWGPVRVKCAPAVFTQKQAEGGPFAPSVMAPEYEDCRAIAEKNGQPLRKVLEMAQRLAEEKFASLATSS